MISKDEKTTESKSGVAFGSSRYMVRCSNEFRDSVIGATNPRDGNGRLMKLHCLGTAGYHPNDARHTSCYAIPDVNIVLDAGSGFYRIGGLLRSDTIHILLSHAI